MAKPGRVFQNQFGLNGAQGHFDQFGARASTGSGVFTKDPASIQALSAFLNNGWPDAINPTNNAPFLEDMNALFYLLFYQICYGFQEGIPEWDPSTTYFSNSIVKKPGTTELYGSIIDNNVGNALPNQTANGQWTYLNPQTTPAGTVDDFAGPSAPFGWLLCDGTVYAQASFPALYTAIGTNWNTGGEGAGNFRVPDLRGRATIGAGTGSGLSPRSLAQTLGEEGHVLSVGELAAHGHGVNDTGHTHGLALQGGIAAGSPNAQLVNGAGSDRTTSAATTGISIQGTGSNSPHNNMQPSAVLTKIIKT